MSAFQSAAEFFDAGETEREDPETPLAKSILWYDAATPVFVCCDHAEVLAPLRFVGDSARPENYDELRAQAYRWLIGAEPACDACAGRLREVLQR